MKLPLLLPTFLLPLTSATKTPPEKCITQSEAETWLPRYIAANNETLAREVFTKDYKVYSNSLLSLQGLSVRPTYILHINPKTTPFLKPTLSDITYSSPRQA